MRVGDKVRVVLVGSSEEDHYDIIEQMRTEGPDCLSYLAEVIELDATLPLGFMGIPGPELAVSVVLLDLEPSPYTGQRERSYLVESLGHGLFTEVNLESSHQLTTMVLVVPA